MYTNLPLIYSLLILPKLIPVLAHHLI